MDQKKIGQFLKALRVERGMTQEQLAEVVGVSNRSISRWENGVNLPDFDLLIVIAGYFGVSIEELLDGERKAARDEKPADETLLKVADYNSQESMAFFKRVRYIFWVDLAAFIVYMVLDILELADSGTGEAVASFALGLVFGTLIVGTLYTSRYMSKIRAFKRRLLRRDKR